MAKGVNRVIIIGNLGADPEGRVTAHQTAICNFTVATSESWKDKQTGQQQERVEWHKCTAFGKLAEICNEYLRKGSKVFLEGSLRTDAYEKDGEKRYATKIIVNEMQMLDSRNDSTGQAAPHQPGQTPAAQGSAAPSSRMNANGTMKSTTAPPMEPGFDNFDDDIPF